MNVEALLRRVEENGSMNAEELRIFIGSCIPESCEDCFWLKDKQKSCCRTAKEAPCRMYLHRILNYLESRGLI